MLQDLHACCFSQTICCHYFHLLCSCDSAEKVEEPKLKRGQDAPLNELSEDDRVEFSNGFVLERDGDVYSCS